VNWDTANVTRVAETREGCDCKALTRHVRRVPPSEGEEQDSVSQRSPLSMSSLRPKLYCVAWRGGEKGSEKVVGQTGVGNKRRLIPGESMASK